MEKLLRVPDDGLDTPSIGLWSEQKYRLLALYGAMFTNSMKKKWDCRVYVDLFAGPGRGRLDGGDKGIVLGSPLIALTLRTPFSKFVFCEAEPAKLDSLRKRVAAMGKSDSVAFVAGDANEKIDEILSALPRFSRDFTVLGFCFVDPYKIADFSFDTLRPLAKRKMDFVILIPSFMDANRNIATQLNSDGSYYDAFLGSPNWRKEWPDAERRGRSFGSFFSDFFARQMKTLGYKYEDQEADLVLIRNPTTHSPLYHLGFFSKSALGRTFWSQAQKYAVPQLDLF